MSVRPKAFSGFTATLLQVFGIGPKFSITCGNCSMTFKQRLPTGIDYPGVRCPGCGEINEMPLTWGK